VPLSLASAAQFSNSEQFLFWNPATDTFGSGIAGRIKRIDPFVSLWHKASRRANIYFAPGTDASAVTAIQHNLTGTVYLLSRTFEQDAWQGGSAYNEMHRAHKAMAPSGGKGQYLPAAVSGSGDDLGAVTLGPAVTIYLDVERSGSARPDESIQLAENESYVYLSANVTPQEGDFLVLGTTSYRVEEAFFDTGFLATKTVKAAPAYTTVTFSFPGASAPVYDPSTGGLTSGSWDEREVSVLIDDTEIVGRPTDRDLEESRTLYIYTRHIGFEPLPGMQVEIAGRTYRVVRVDSNVEARQWKVKVEP
jgi:hypothetical protein